eukprot:UN4164
MPNILNEWYTMHLFSLEMKIYQYRTCTKFNPYKASLGLFVPKHCYRIFTQPNISPAHVRKTAIESFHPSCRSLLKRQGNLLPWDRYCYGQRLFE